MISSYVYEGGDYFLVRFAHNDEYVAVVRHLIELRRAQPEIGHGRVSRSQAAQAAVSKIGWPSVITTVCSIGLFPLPGIGQLEDLRCLQQLGA